MRIQLDSSLSGADATKAGGIGQTSAAVDSGANSSRLGASASAGQDSIQISGPSNALNRLATGRAQQLQQLTLSVQSGSYQVSSSRVGNAIVDHAIS
jgi:anti-sigma28 factor (negative regulator of flagellin synthesis)